MGVGAPYPEMSILFEYDINLFLKRIMDCFSIGSILVYKNPN